MTIWSDSLLRALGWALAHSLWQGALFALVLFVLLPRLQTARQKYWAAYGTLLSMFAASAASFIWKFEPAASVPAPVPAGGGADKVLVSYWVDNHYFSSGYLESFSAWLETNHILVVAVWLIGFFFFLLRLMAGLWQLRRLRTSGLQLLDAYWDKTLDRLSEQIRVPRRVRIFESVWVQSPLTLGWLKPLILLPVGFVNHLSTAEVEAVLAHELAHIARRDWFFNLIQAFVESLFYYHPAVWWVSRVIRRERENACDDVALSATGNPIAFARALVQVQEMATPLPALALALSGKRRRPLLERVRRILNQAPQQQHQVMEKITATVILLALLALVGLRANSVPSLGSAFAQIAELPGSIFGQGENQVQIVEDSLPKPKNTRKITREDDNGRVEAEYKDGKLERLNIDGKEIPASEFEAHEELVEELSEEMAPAPPHIYWGSPAAPPPPNAPRAYGYGSAVSPGGAPIPPYPPVPPFDGNMSIVTDKDGEGNTIISLDNNGHSTEVVVKNGEVWIDGKKVDAGEQVDIPGLQFGAGGQPFFFHGSDGEGFAFGGNNFDHPQAFYGFPEPPEPPELAELPEHLEHLEQLEKELAELKDQHQKALKAHQRNFERDQKHADKARKESEKDWQKEQKNWEKEQKLWQENQEKWQEQQQQWQKQQREWEVKSKATQELLKKEMLRDGLISNPDNFSMRLSSKQLEVNGKKQPEALRKKYEELMEGAMGQRFEGNDWNYNFNFNDDK